MAIDAEPVIRARYAAFNARELDRALETMHADVDWPNAWEGGRVSGREDVREYWERQFAAISSQVEPRRFAVDADGSIVVDVHQVVRDADSGELLSEKRRRGARAAAGFLYLLICSRIRRISAVSSPAL
jgi:ketosteroid isomerase-like protein